MAVHQVVKDAFDGWPALKDIISYLIQAAGIFLIYRAIQKNIAATKAGLELSTAIREDTKEKEVLIREVNLKIFLWKAKKVQEILQNQASHPDLTGIISILNNYMVQPEEIVIFNKLTRERIIEAWNALQFYINSWKDETGKFNHGPFTIGELEAKIEPALELSHQFAKLIREIEKTIIKPL